MLHENVTLPTPYIKLYDKEGQLTGYKYFHNLDHEPMGTTTTSAEQNDTRVDNTRNDDSSASSRAVEKRDDSGPSAMDEGTGYTSSLHSNEQKTTTEVNSKL